VDLSKFTPTQQRMLQLLMDGLPHSPAELHGCLYDEMSAVRTVKYHLSTMRKILRPAGLDVLTQVVKFRVHYRLVRLLSSPYKG
jgi:hypothetical protein